MYHQASVNIADTFSAHFHHDLDPTCSYSYGLAIVLAKSFKNLPTPLQAHVAARIMCGNSGMHDTLQLWPNLFHVLSPGYDMCRHCQNFGKTRAPVMSFASGSCSIAFIIAKVRNFPI